MWSCSVKKSGVVTKTSVVARNCFFNLMFHVHHSVLSSFFPSASSSFFETSFENTLNTKK